MTTQVVPEQNVQSTESLATSGAVATDQGQTSLAVTAAPAPATPTVDVSPQIPVEPKGSEPEGDKPADEPKMLDELKRTRKRAQLAEQREAYLQGQLEEARKAQTPEIVPPTSKSVNEDKPPVLTDFSDIEQYEEAKFQYRWHQAEKQRVAEEQAKKKQEEQEKQKGYQEKVDREFYNRVNKVVEKLPDYQEVVRSASLELPTEVLQAIKESDIGPEVAYHLAKNEDEAEKLKQMSISSAVREIGKIEARLSAPAAPPQKQTKQVTQAPEPIKPTGGAKSVVEKDYDSLSMDEFVERRRREVAERRKTAPSWK